MSQISHEPPAPAVAREPRRRRIIEAALVAILALTLNLAGNGRVSLWDRDEPRFAGCVREMRARCDWTHPTFNGEPRYQKPILIYWLMGAGYAVSGDNPFGARLTSSIAGTATCLVVWFFGRRLFGRRAGRLGALMLATAPIMVVESKLATTDATLTLWLVGCQFCLWELSRRPSWRIAAVFWALLALAMLTKGPVGPAIIAVSGLASWWLGGPTSCWRRLHWRSGLAAFVLLTAPWFVAVGVISHGEFFRVALGEQVLKRMTTRLEEHGGFPGYYLVTTLLTFHPWSSLLPAAVVGAWARRKGQPALAFLLGWIIGPFILLECVQTKLLHYYLPAYPACALLAGWLVVAVANDEVNLRRWRLGRLGIGLLGGVGIGVIAALVAVAMLLPTGLLLPCLALALVLSLGTLVALAKLHQGATERAVAFLVATWALMMVGIGAWLLPAAQPYRTSRIVGERLARLSTELKAQPILLTFQEPSLIYAFGRPLPTIHTYEELMTQLQRHGEVITPVLAHELVALQSKPFLDVHVQERLLAFNLNKGESQPLQFARIRARSLTRVTIREQAFVK